MLRIQLSDLRASSPGCKPAEERRRRQAETDQLVESLRREVESLRKSAAKSRRRVKNVSSSALPAARSGVSVQARTSFAGGLCLAALVAIPLLALPTSSPAAEAQSVIFDTDLGADVDDAGAVAVLPRWPTWAKPRSWRWACRSSIPRAPAWTP